MRLDVEELAHRRRYKNGERTLFSRRINFEAGCAPAPDDSRLIVAIPSHGNGGVRIPMMAKRGGVESSRVEGKHTATHIAARYVLNSWYASGTRAQISSPLLSFSWFIALFPAIWFESYAFINSHQITIAISIAFRFAAWFLPRVVRMCAHTYTLISILFKHRTQRLRYFKTCCAQ